MNEKYRSLALHFYYRYHFLCGDAAIARAELREERKGTQERINRIYTLANKAYQLHQKFSKKWKADKL